MKRKKKANRKIEKPQKTHVVYVEIEAPVTHIGPLPKKSRMVLVSGIVGIYGRRIRGLEKEQDRLFKQACRRLRVKGEPQETVLFDYLFNGPLKGVTPRTIAERVWPVKAQAKP